MLRSGAFWLGVATGAVGSWLLARRASRLVQVNPHGPIPLSRSNYRGQGWPTPPGSYSR